MDLLNPKRQHSYDWLQDSLRSICHHSFLDDPTIEIHSIEPRLNRSFPHLEYRFVLESKDVSFRLILRLYHGIFSLWGGIDNLKASKEFAVLRHVYQSGFTSPFPYCFGPSLNPFGYPYLILDAGDGKRWWDFEDSLRQHQETLTDSMAEHLAKLHTSVAAKHPLIPTVDLATVLKKLWPRIRNSGNKELIHCMQNCAKRLPNQYSLQSVLLHGAFDLDHVLISNEKIRTVVNWEHAAIGDPRWDVAHTVLTLVQDNNRSLANRFVARYVQHTGNPLDDLGFWEGFVGLRNYALLEWIKTMDNRSMQAVIGLEQEFKSLEDRSRMNALRYFD